MGVTFEIIRKTCACVFVENNVYIIWQMHPLIMKAVCNTLYNYLTFLSAYCHPARFTRTTSQVTLSASPFCAAAPGIYRRVVTRSVFRQAARRLLLCPPQTCGLFLHSTFFESTFDKVFTFCLFLYCAGGKNDGPRPRILSIFRSDGRLSGDGFQW